MIGAAPGAGRAAPRAAKFRAIVAGKNKYRVIAQSIFFNKIRYLANSRIHLQHRVGEIACAGLACELVVRQRRVMQLRQWHIRKKGLLRSNLALHEIDAALNQLRIDFSTEFKIVDRDVCRSLAVPRLHHIRHRHYRGVKPRRAGKHALVGGARNAEPLIEAAIRRVTSRPVTEMPLAMNCRGVAL